MTDTFYTSLREEAEKLDISLEDATIQQLFTYYQMLVETNKVMNLTAITEEQDVVKKHFIDSMAIVKAVNAIASNVSRETSDISTFFKDKTMIDVGTGAGFPGLVLKIVFPGLHVVLTDSLNKRITFLDHVIRALELTGVETVHGRAEDLGQSPAYREKFDFAVSRAVANLATLSEYDLPFVRKNGYFIAYKSGEISEETEKAAHAIGLLGGKQEARICYMLPDSDIARSLIVIRKAKETPRKYPRKSGMPSKTPL